MKPHIRKKKIPRHDARQLVILTGLSGSGKGSVLNTFEDLGFYCVDNLPVALIPMFSELYGEGRGEIERAALLVDAREGEQLDKLPGIYRKLIADHPATLVFVEASDEALLRRFSETRRPHPLGHDVSIVEGIREERRRMAPIRRLADVVIDTTKFNVHELRQFILDRFQKPGQR
ncbi:MAG: RNase adapter RapZ, partial [Candidatus Binataceae bacterium]